jgi:thioredoxin reductase (NADPH)
LILSCLGGGREFELETGYLVIAVGREPCLGFLSPDLLEKWDILVRQEILYPIGDVGNDRYRQTAIAVGDGVLAAMKIADKFGANRV